MHEKFNNIEELEVLLEKTDKASIEPIYNKDGEQKTDWVEVYNQTKGYTETCVPKNKGKVICHNEAFQPLVNALKDQTGADFFGFFHNHGGRVTVEVLFNNAIVKDGSADGIRLGIRFQNDYSRQSFRGENYGFRSVCQNGMSLGKTLYNSLSQSHKNIAGMNKEILSFIETALNKTQLLEDTIEKAKIDNFLNEEDALRVLVGEVAKEKAAKKMLELIEDQSSLSRYNLYNCITAFATHAVTSETTKNYYQGMAQKILTTSSNRLYRGELKKDKQEA